MQSKTLDARGLTCPLPVLKARKILLTMQVGEILEVLSSDPRSATEFTLYCEESGFSLLSAIKDNLGDWKITIAVK